MDKPEFDQSIRMLRSCDPLEYEDGYHWLLGFLDTYMDELTELMLSENDPGMRGKFIELIGASHNPKVIPLLAAELKSPHGEVRSWAYSALRYFEHPEAVQLAESFKQQHPEEEFL